MPQVEGLEVRSAAAGGENGPCGGFAFKVAYFELQRSPASYVWFCDAKHGEKLVAEEGEAGYVLVLRAGIDVNVDENVFISIEILVGALHVGNGAEVNDGPEDGVFYGDVSPPMADMGDEHLEGDLAGEDEVWFWILLPTDEKDAGQQLDG